jgi:hypothetical protein
MAVRLSALRAGRPLPPGRFLARIYSRLMVLGSVEAAPTFIIGRSVKGDAVI